MTGCYFIEGYDIKVGNTTAKSLSMNTSMVFYMDRGVVARAKVEGAEVREARHDIRWPRPHNHSGHIMVKKNTYTIVNFLTQNNNTAGIEMAYVNL
jgi:hypothetical protein